MQVIRQGELAVPMLTYYDICLLSTLFIHCPAHCSLLSAHCIPRAPLAVPLTAHSSAAQEDNEWLNRTVRRGRRTMLRLPLSTMRAAPCKGALTGPCFPGK